MTKRLTLAEQLAEISKPAPVDFDPEDAFTSYTKKRGDSQQAADDGAREHYEVVGPSTLRKKGAAIIDEKYEGRKGSRKELYAEDSDEEIDSEQGDFEEDNEEGDFEDLEAEVNGGAGDESEEEDEEDERPPVRPTRKQPHRVEQSEEATLEQEEKAMLKQLKQAASADVEKGRDVKKQLATCDAILEARIKFQKAITAINQLPLVRFLLMNVKASPQEQLQPSTMEDLLPSVSSELSDTLKAVETLNEDLFALRTQMMKEDNLEIPDDFGANRKRKRDQNEDEESFAASLLDLQTLDARLEPFLRTTVTKWSDKVLAASSLVSSQNKFKAVNQNAMAQIDHALGPAERERLLKRTRVNRGDVKRIGGEGEKVEMEVEMQKGEDPEVFDDGDWYQTLLKEIVESRSLDLDDSAMASLRLTNGRGKKIKKVVDTRASKGRKIRYHVHEKIQNFMIPIDGGGWHDEQIDELFAGLLGKAAPVANGVEHQAKDVERDKVSRKPPFFWPLLRFLFAESKSLREAEETASAVIHSAGVTMDSDPVDATLGAGVVPIDADMPIDYGEALDAEEAYMAADDVLPTSANPTSGGEEADAEMDDDVPTSEGGDMISDLDAPAALNEIVPDSSALNAIAPLPSTTASELFANGITVTTGVPPPLNISPTTTMSEEGIRPPHPGFAAPPTSVVGPDGLQISLVGISGMDDFTSNPLPFSHHPGGPVTPGIAPLTPPPVRAVDPPPSSSVSNVPPLLPLASSPSAEHPGEQISAITGTSPQGQTRALEGSHALAAQHQHTEDGKQSQDQSVEQRGPGEVRVHQGQTQEREEGEDAEQENEVTVRTRKNSIPGKEDHLEVDMDQKNKGGKTNGTAPVNQINHVKVYKRGEDCASGTLSGGTTVRPNIRKRLLTIVDLSDLFPDAAGGTDPNPDDEDPESTSNLAAPPVLLTYANETYSLFAPHEGDDGPLPTLLEDKKDHELYYDQIETLLESLHTALPQLSSKDHELVLSFDEIGITLTEDNVYTREVCLYDFDRIHVGCGLPGRLHFTVEQQPRFSTGFNALAQHIANSHAPDEANTNHQLTEEDEETIDRQRQEPLDTTDQDADQKEEDENIEEVPEKNDEEEPREEGEEDELVGDDVIGGEGDEAEAQVDGADETFEDGEWYEAQAEDETIDGAAEGEAGTNDEVEGAADEALPEADEEVENVAEEEGEGLADEGDGSYQLVEAEDASPSLPEPEATGEDATPSTVPPSSSVPPSGSTSATSHEPSASTTPVPGLAISLQKADDDVPEQPLPVAQEDGALATNDVVIDYEEAFDGGSRAPSPFPAVANGDAPAASDGLLSPKRAREEDESAVTDAEGSAEAPTSGDSKRARLSDPAS